MAEEAESLTIRLLQEMRADIQELRTEMHEMRTDLSQRVDGNTLTFNLVAGVVYDHKQRLSALEELRSRFED